MCFNFSVLGSGSSGNASLLEVNGQGVLIDLGLGPRQLASRLKAVATSWQSIDVAILTHVHSDHWNELTLAYLEKRAIVLYCHPAHQVYLERYSPAFSRLLAAGLVRVYESEEELGLVSGLRCRPIELQHDGGITCGFGFEAVPASGPPYRLGYATDLGCWEPNLVEAFADADLLALEFNHDVDMEVNSGRSPRLIERVLGDQGHLSNDQAAQLVQAILDSSQPGRLQHLVQLHLSRQCNLPELAQAAVQALGDSWKVHTACQEEAGPSLRLGHDLQPMATASATESYIQPWLPGWE